VHGFTLVNLGINQPVDPDQVQSYFVRQGRYTAGTCTHYPPSRLTATAEHQSLASGFNIGQRFHSARVVRLADARPVQLGHTIKADGRWRFFALAPASDRPESLIVKHTLQG
jgi:phenol 2-monooxygenase (NADPH)